jgi:protein ImuA
MVPRNFYTVIILAYCPQRKKEHNRNMKFDINTLQCHKSKLYTGQNLNLGPVISFGDHRIDRIFGGGLRKHAMHEIYGPGAVALACMLASLTTGTIIWIKPHSQQQQLNPDGIFQIKNNVNNYINIFSKDNDTLWAAEKSVRSGACSVVIVEAKHSPDFVSSRRLQLIAGEQKTLVIILSPNGKNIHPSAAETQFNVNFFPTTAQKLPRLQVNLFKNKRGTKMKWEMEWHGPEVRFNLVSLHSY